MTVLIMIVLIVLDCTVLDAGMLADAEISAHGDWQAMNRHGCRITLNSFMSL